MPKIAIIAGETSYDEEKEEDRFLRNSISDWTEVDKDTYVKLHQHIHLLNTYYNRYRIIERVDTPVYSIPDIIKQIDKELAERKAAEIKSEKLRKERSAKREAARKAKQKETELETYMKLKEKFKDA